ncbi:hypothetical protein AALP_AA3G173500 [Arabis alpina]|uniref:TF-B3 domain-containing protein n=1 Tax=Arabis alpina TaxID=50452 RepID=A0A087H9T2_ARAAL|nr:hypothetical protein AALP_AA3G173500 [Arabis alpina]
MEKPDSPRVSPPDFWNLKLLADVAAEEYDTRSRSTKSPTCPSTTPRVSLSRPSRNLKLIVLAEVASTLLAREKEEEDARLFVNVPRKNRSLGNRHRSSSKWMRAIEKQRSIELENPNNPETPPSSCVSESKKRRVSEEEERSLKKRKIVSRFEVGSSSRPKEESRVEQNPNLDLGSSCISKREEERSHKKPTIVLPTETNPPEWLVNVMMREGNGYNPKLIIVRKLYKSDLSRVQARLSMPLNQVVNTDFLTEEETRIIHEQSVLKSRKLGVSVDLVDPLLNKHEVDLRMWQMNGNWNYVIVVGWNDVVAKNTFRVDDVLHVWSFRSGVGKLCFAFVPPPTTRNSSQGCSTSGESSHGCSALA